MRNTPRATTRNMMRVALIAPPIESVPPRFYGGTERVIYNLCKGLSRHGIDVTLFASADSESETKLIPVVKEALRLRDPPVREPWPYHIQMLALAARHGAEFDVIHNHHDYWMLPLSEMCPTPLITTLHGRLDLMELSEIYDCYPKVSYVSISDSQRTPLKDVRWIKTIHHGIDADDFLFHPTPGNYLAFLGRISEDKKPEWAIEIAKRAAIPLKIAAKIEGQLGREYYDRKVRPHVDGKWVEYVGEISEREKSEFLGNALGLVFPVAWPEPFGLVLIESLACGTPVLARPCGAVPEILYNNITGYTHSSLAMLARRVRDLPKIDRRGCRQWVQERFSLKRMTEDYIDVFQQVCGTGAYEPESAGGKLSRRRHLLHSV